MGNCCMSDFGELQFKQNNGSTLPHHKSGIKKQKSKPLAELLKKQATISSIKVDDINLKERKDSIVEIDCRLDEILSEDRKPENGANVNGSMGSEAIFSKLNREKQFVNVFQPSVSNMSAIQKLQNGEPNSSFFQGIPRLSQFTSRNSVVQKHSSRPSTQIQKERKFQDPIRSMLP